MNWGLTRRCKEDIHLEMIEDPQKGTRGARALNISPNFASSAAQGKTISVNPYVFLLPQGLPDPILTWLMLGWGGVGWGDVNVHLNFQHTCTLRCRVGSGGGVILKIMSFTMLGRIHIEVHRYTYTHVAIQTYAAYETNNEHMYNSGVQQ